MTAAESKGLKKGRRMRSSCCTRSSNEGSRRRLCYRRQIQPQCCSGRCSHQDRSTCARLMVGRRSPQSPSISRLTLQPETIPSCYRRSRHTEFQPHSGRHRAMSVRILIMRNLPDETLPIFIGWHC
jgi:hypothetical protein